jgi:diadenylate cyclase
MRQLVNAITTYLQRVSNYDPWVILVQLLMIGVVVWLVMRFLRGTRGARLVKGAALILATFFIVVRLLPKNDDWKRIEFLYGNFLLFALVAFVVAFQPELRRALISVGQTKFFRSRRSEIDVFADKFMKSIIYFSRNKIGAIVALERSVGLNAIADTGTRIGAEFSTELLNTIFYPGTYLHDMGVVISHERIAAAGCQFPMSESDDVESELGSRHRAALGLSMDCDAMIVIVSEETGKISIAFEGKLHRDLTPDNLLKVIRRAMTEYQFKPKTSLGGGHHDV